MEPKELTEEQKKKIRRLMHSHLKNSAWSGLKVGSLLFFANAIVVLSDALYVHNQAFVFIAAAMNAIFILPILSRDSKKERDRLKEEAKKILEN